MTNLISTVVAGRAVGKAIGRKRARDELPRSRTFELTGRYPGEDEDEDEPLRQARRKKVSKRRGAGKRRSGDKLGP